MVPSTLATLLFSVLFLAASAADCNDKCPYGNNDCKDVACTRCFPMFPNNWSEGRCTHGAACFGRCDADTDCDQASKCKFCRDHTCTTAKCMSKSCDIDHECHEIGYTCPYCDTTVGCTANFNCPKTAFSSILQGGSCQSGPTWHFYDACSSDCHNHMGSNQCASTPEGLEITAQKCVKDCICRGAQADLCYSKAATFAGARMQSGQAFCYGVYTWTAQIGHDANNNTVADSQDMFLLNNDVSCADCKGNVQWILSPNKNISAEWVSTIKVTSQSGSVCHFVDIPTTIHLASIVDVYTIELTPKDVRFSIGGNVYYTYTFTSSCTAPKMPVYASYISRPGDNFSPQAMYTTLLESFSYKPPASIQ